jgi:hypothetical protein
MKITVDSTVFEVGLVSYEPSYESGIKWGEVGGKHKPRDRGPDTAKWSSDITIRGEGLVVANLRAAILAEGAKGGTIEIECNEFEPIFGPEFTYNGIGFGCLIDASEAPFATGSLNTDVPTEWTFSAFPPFTIASLYINNTGTFPNTVSMISAERLDNGDRTLINTATGRASFGFGFSAPTCEIVYEGLRMDVAQAKAYLQTRRSSPFTLSTDLVWPFEVGVTTQSVYVLDIEDNGALDKAGIYHSFTVVYGKA